MRLNRDTSLFGIDPNGQYQFGGGAAYSPVAIQSLSGAHNIPVGGLLPDALTGLLTASAFTYTTAVAPLLFPQGARIGDAGIHRDAYNVFFQDSWKISDRLLLNYGLRYEIESRIREPNRQTSAPVLGGGPAWIRRCSSIQLRPTRSTKMAGDRAWRWNGARPKKHCCAPEPELPRFW